MDENAYERVDLDKLQLQGRTEQKVSGFAADGSQYRIRWLVLPLSLMLCLLQVVLTIGASNINQTYITSTLIPVVGFVVLMVLVALVNPVLRLLRLIRPLGRAELMSVFAAMLVTAGIATFGLADQLIPVISAPWNPDWNTPQAGWDRHVLPHLNPNLYLTVPDDATEGEKAKVMAVIQQSRGILTQDRGQMLSPSAIERLRQAIGTLRRVVEGSYVDPGEFEAALKLLRDHQAGMGERWRSEFAQMVMVLHRCQAHSKGKNIIRLFRESVSVSRPDDSDGWSKWLGYYSEVFKQVPWSAWAKPLGYWLIFVFGCYGMFYFLMYVVMDQWTRRDKLVFPLARLPEALIVDSDRSGRWWPRSLTTSAFWLGFAVSFGLLSYNSMAEAGWLSGLSRISLGLKGQYVSALLMPQMLKGLAGGIFDLRFIIFFTAIGIAFLLSTEISFSVWFYFWVGKLLVLVAVWMGYGQSGQDFPADWIWETNFVTSIGVGALFFFSAVTLLRSFGQYIKIIRGQAPRQRVKLLLPVIGLGVCSAVVIGWLCWNWWPATQTSGDRLNALMWASIISGFIALLTVGLMRVVAESGVFWFQNFGGSFFHFYNVLGLGAVLKATLVAPLLAIYGVLFLDIKTFMAPNLINAAKIGQDVGAGRLRFHLNLIVCVAVTVVFSLAGTIYLGHQRGANQMSPWFYTSYMKEVIMPKSAMIIKSEADATFQVGQGAWYATGAGWVGMTMLLRRSIFWFPHPVGCIMMNNPLISSLWFSFFLGWLAKKLVVKYGGKFTFDRVQLLFIGLIMGELIAVFLWSMISLRTGIELANIVTLNRYIP